MSSRLDILGVQAFVSIAELGTFRAAANHLHLSESALGRRLKKLEDDLGVRLIARTTRAISLSAEGANFLPLARRVVQDLAASLDNLRTADGKPSGTLRLGCLPTLAASRLPAMLRVFAQAFPAVRVQVFDRSASEIREAVLNGEVDFAITVSGLTHHKIEAESLFSEAMVAVCPVDHPLARQTSLTWCQLSGEPLISIGMLSANRALIDTLIHDIGLPLAWTYQVEHLATAVALVSGGSGIAILPEAAVYGRKDDNLRVLSLRQPVLRRDIVLLRRKLPVSAAAAHFAQLVRSGMLAST